MLWTTEKNNHLKNSKWAKAEALHHYCTGLSLTQAILRHFLHIKKSSQAIILTGFSGSGNVIRTHDTSGMKKSKLEIKDMDDGVDVGWLRTEVLCGLNTFMNTVNSQKFQLFGNPESFKTKFTSAKNTYHLILKSNVQKTHFAFFFLHDFIHTIFRAESAPPLHPPAHRIRSAK